MLQIIIHDIILKENHIILNKLMQNKIAKDDFN